MLHAAAAFDNMGAIDMVPVDLVYGTSDVLRMLLIAYRNWR